MASIVNGTSGNVVKNGNKAINGITNGSMTNNAENVSITHEIPPQLRPYTILTVSTIVSDQQSVDVSKDVFVSLFGSQSPVNSSRTFYMSLKLLGTSLDQFVVFKLGSIMPQIGKLTVRMPLKVMGMTVAAGTAFAVAVSPLQLSHVVVKCDHAAYSLLRGIAAFGDLEDSLVRKGDVVDIRGFEVVVALCEPVAQGLICTSTKITVVLDDSSLESSELKESEIVVEEIGTMSSSETDVSTLLYGSAEEYFASILNDPVSVPSLTLKISTLSCQQNHISPAPAIQDDPETFMFIHPQSLIKLNYFSGDYGKVKFGSQVKIVKLISFSEPSSFSAKAAYISPVLHFNLGLPQSVEIVRKNDQGLNFPLVKSVTIARVPSPVTLNRSYQQSYLEGLKNYFEAHNRVVSKDMLIPITIDTVLAKSCFQLGVDSSAFGKGSPNSVSWFQITGLECDQNSSTNQYIVDPLKSRMLQSGTADVNLSKTIKTSHLYTYLNLPEQFEYTKVFDYATKLRNLMSTTLIKGICSKMKLETGVLLHSQTRNVGKSTVIANLANELAVDLLEIECIELVYTPGSELKTIGIIAGRLENVVRHMSSPLVVLFKHLECICGNKEGKQTKTTFEVKFVELLKKAWSECFVKGLDIMFIATVNDIDDIGSSLKNIFNFTIEVNVPSSNERTAIFEYLNSHLSTVPVTEVSDRLQCSYGVNSDVRAHDLSVQSAGLGPADIRAIITGARLKAQERFQKISQKHNISIIDCLVSNNGITLSNEDFDVAISNARNNFSESIGAPKIPNVKWDDVGGLDQVKDQILETIEMPLQNPQLFNNGLKKRSGILFYGPPGTGKTLLAKAIATNFSLNFFSVKGPELLNMYIGESEANVRRVFQKARDAKPCVVFFDELDSVAPKRGNQGDSGGVMDRIVSQLLSELDGMSGDQGDGVFVVGATNRPDLLDEALLRPGRFDKMVYLGIADSHEKQHNILKALTRKFSLDEDVDLRQIADSLPFNYTGADFYALSSDSMLNAMSRKAKEADIKIKQYNEGQKEEVNSSWWFDNVATEEDVTFSVKREDFEKARRALIPSVSMEELNHYQRVRQMFEGGGE